MERSSHPKKQEVNPLFMHYFQEEGLFDYEDVLFRLQISTWKRLSSKYGTCDPEQPGKKPMRYFKRGKDRAFDRIGRVFTDIGSFESFGLGVPC
ncbi:hypothetical protein [Robiginitalea aurantiaca]|uniref:Uncharacterized protein n=1 Tax=Robiginitalea aurantiaca TaxID=3056915 RepID=A0ABT7WDH2_9FLAO|nr:hypothetical protein [Robiginitalea aurantiaca]MDM9630958.1 hypothetical protein [Robiginitalea aurantiaca]